MQRKSDFRKHVASHRNQDCGMIPYSPEKHINATNKSRTYSVKMVHGQPLDWLFGAGKIKPRAAALKSVARAVTHHSPKNTKNSSFPWPCPWSKTKKKASKKPSNTRPSPIPHLPHSVSTTRRSGTPACRAAGCSSSRSCARRTKSSMPGICSQSSSGAMRWTSGPRCGRIREIRRTEPRKGGWREEQAPKVTIIEYRLPFGPFKGFTS